jgi:hypothetical protein
MNIFNNEQRILEINAERDSILQFSRWPEKLRASLNFVKDHPELSNIVGLLLISNRKFAANATIYANFIGCETNSLRLAFRTHGVPTLEQAPSYLTQGLINPRFWKLHVASDDIFESNLHETFRYVRYPNRVRRVVESTLPSEQTDADCIWNSDFESWEIGDIQFEE